MQFELDKFNKILNELKADFDTVAMAKSAYILEHLNVKTHEHETVQWAQCLEEMRRRYYGIKRALIQAEILRRDINALETTTGALEAELKRVDLEELEWSINGSWQEFLALYNIYQDYPHFTREQIEAAQPEYWETRLKGQARRDILSSGRISAGNLDALRMIDILPVVENGQVSLSKNGKLINGA